MSRFGKKCARPKKGVGGRQDKELEGSFNYQKLKNPKTISSKTKKSNPPQKKLVATQKLKQSKIKSKSSNQEKHEATERENTKPKHTTRWRGRNGRTEVCLPLPHSHEGGHRLHTHKGWQPTKHRWTQKRESDFTQRNTRHMRAKL